MCPTPTPDVGYLVYGHNRHFGGIGRYTQELHGALQRVGLCPTVLQAGGRANGSLVHTLPGSRLLPGLLTVGQLEIACVARKQRIRLVHDPTGTMPLFLTGAKRVSTIHDVIPFTFPKSSTRLDWLIYRFWLPIAVRRLDLIITDSNHSRRDIVRQLRVPGSKVITIPCASSRRYRPLDRSEYKDVLSSFGLDFPYILCVGSPVPRKNVTRLVEAFARLRRWSGKWKLVIAGAGNWKRSPVYETVERLDLADNVHFAGFVNERDLPALYNGADLFVFPSLYEGFGLPVLEAMACGTPVVASSTSSIPEVAADGALLVDPLNVEALAAAVRRPLEDLSLAGALRASGLARAQQFTWERCARETIDVYERLLGEKILD